MFVLLSALFDFKICIIRLIFATKIVTSIATCTATKNYLIMAKFNVIYNRKKQTDNKGLALIEISIFHDGKRKYKSTGFRILEKQWDGKNQRVINHPKATHINATLTQYIAQLQQNEVQLLTKMKPYTVADILAENGEKPPTFLEFAQKEAANRNTCYKSKNLYKTVINNLLDFVGDDFYCEKITLKFVRDFDNFLRTKKLHQNTIVKRHQVFKLFINAAIRDGLMEVHQNPYLNFTVKKLPSVRRALEREQLSELEKLNLPPQIEIVKDLFLFSCYTGLRYSDMASIEKSNIVRTNDGVYLNIREQKTNKLKQNIPLHILFNGKAVAVIDKYETKHRDKIFPTYTDQHLNRMLKVIGAMLRLDFPLTFHCSRHTFGTMLAEKTQDPYLIKELMNHSDLKTSMIYIHSSKKRIENSLKNVDWEL